MKESDQPLENSWFYYDEEMWTPVSCQNTTDMGFLESFIKEVLAHNTFSIKSVQVYVVNKMCDFFFSFLIKTCCRQA